MEWSDRFHDNYVYLNIVDNKIVVSLMKLEITSSVNYREFMKKIYCLDDRYYDYIYNFEEIFYSDGDVVAFITSDYEFAEEFTELVTGEKYNLEQNYAVYYHCTFCINDCIDYEEYMDDSECILKKDNYEVHITYM